MTVKDIINVLEEMAPTAWAEDFDNVGLLVGDANKEATGVLVCHDALESVIDEAIANKCNMIVCFHPILFSGLKKITGKTYVERIVMKALQHQIAIYAVHTALDNHPQGVNKLLCNALGVLNTQILVPKKQFIQKLITYTPASYFEIVRQALWQAGAGQIGNYYNCSFASEGKGTFIGNDESDPIIGQKHVFTEIEELKIEVTFEKHLQAKIVAALHQAHPYDEVAYEIYQLENAHQNIGLGMVGELEHALEEVQFLQMVKETLHCGGIRHSAFRNQKIKKVAVLGGSGSSAITAAKRAGADAFITADLKYHQYYEAENQLLLIDVGHFESERHTKNYIFEFLTKKISNFAIILSKENTNPVKYF